MSDPVSGTQPSDVVVEDRPERQRYVALVDGEVAGFVAYDLADGVVDLLHTEVDDAFEGRGVGSALARGALDDARARGLRVVPSCPFVRRWLTRHPEYAPLVGDVGSSG